MEKTPISEVPADELLPHARKNQPFVVRQFMRNFCDIGIEHPKWDQETTSVVVIPPEEKQVTTIASRLKSSEQAVRMTFGEFFSRNRYPDKFAPIFAEGERYYIFGTPTPKAILDTVDWPSGLAYGNSSCYFSSSELTVKNHYDLWIAFLLQVHGTKTVRMFPPSDYPYLYPIHDEEKGCHRRSLVSVEHTDFGKYPLFRRAHCFETEIGPGDLLFIPLLWWHEVQPNTFSLTLNRRIRPSRSQAMLVYAKQAIHMCRARYVHRTTSTIPYRMYIESLQDLRPQWAKLKTLKGILKGHALKEMQESSELSY